MTAADPWPAHSPRDVARIRAGMIGFVASGVMTLVGLLLRGPNPVDGHSFDAAAFVAASLSPHYTLTWALLLANLTVQIFAWLALWGFVRGSRWERLGFWGMVLSITGNGLFLPVAGVIGLTAPTVARLYQAGDTGVLAIANGAVFGPLALTFLIASALSLLVGAVLTALLVWRVPGLPKWAAVLYGVHALCLTMFAQVHYALEFSGAPLLLVSSVAIAAAVWRMTAVAVADDHRRARL